MPGPGGGPHGGGGHRGGGPHGGGMHGGPHGGGPYRGEMHRPPHRRGWFYGPRYYGRGCLGSFICMFVFPIVIFIAIIALFTF